MTNALKNLLVFCGSSSGSVPTFRAAADQLGRTIADGGHRLIYGGGDVGLMGTVADGALAAGGEVVGVITEHLADLELAHGALTELLVEPSMHARKAKMAELADGVIVLPGGFGTYDEAFELLTWNQLGLVALPVVFLDVDGFFEPLFEFVDAAAGHGFVRPEHAGLVRRANTSDQAVALALQPADGYIPKWVD